MRPDSNRRDGGEREHRHVEPDAVGARHVRGNERPQRARAPPREQQTDAPPDSVSSALSTSERRTSAQRPAPNAAHNAKPFAARRRSREQQVGDVGARDHEHQDDGAEQHPERVADAADDLLVRGHERDAPAVIRIRVLARDVPRRSPPSPAAPARSSRPAPAVRSRLYIRCGRDRERAEIERQRRPQLDVGIVRRETESRAASRRRSCASRRPASSSCQITLGSWPNRRTHAP